MKVTLLKYERFLDCKVNVNYRFNWQNIHRLTGILGKTSNSFKLKKVIKLNLGIVRNFIFTFFLWNVSLICRNLCCDFWRCVIYHSCWCLNKFRCSRSRSGGFLVGSDQFFISYKLRLITNFILWIMNSQLNLSVIIVKISIYHDS